MAREKKEPLLRPRPPVSKTDLIELRKRRRALLQERSAYFALKEQKRVSHAAYSEAAKNYRLVSSTYGRAHSKSTKAAASQSKAKKVLDKASAALDQNWWTETSIMRKMLDLPKWKK